MKIAIYGATGNVGSRIVTAAAERGHEVTALSRHEPSEAPAAGVTWQQGDATDSDQVATVAAAHDAVVSAIGPSRDAGGDPSAFAATLAAISDAVGTTRLSVVGGAGSLLTADGTRLIDTPGFPDAYRTEAIAGADGLAVLRDSRPDLDWTYLSPAPEIGEGPTTDAYRAGIDNPVGSFVSFTDFARALVDELEQPTHRRQRWTVASR